MPNHLSPNPVNPLISGIGKPIPASNLGMVGMAHSANLNTAEQIAIELRVIRKENEALYELVKSMLESLEIIVNNTPEDDNNHFFREGLLKGYTERVGMIIDEAAKQKHELEQKALEALTQMYKAPKLLIGGNQAIQDYNALLQKQLYNDYMRQKPEENK